MDRYKHFEYGEQLASKLKAIQNGEKDKGFFEATEQEDLPALNERISSASGTILIAVDTGESSFDWQNSDSLMEKPHYAFAIVQQTTSGDVDSIISAQQSCKKIAKEIIAKMLQDAHARKSGLEYLERGSFYIKGFGPVGDNFYGVMLFFFFNQGVNYTLNPDMWEA